MVPPPAPSFGVVHGQADLASRRAKRGSGPNSWLTHDLMEAWCLASGGRQAGRP